jgi:predicted lipoprotein with Yx(FWY)xxD motif
MRKAISLSAAILALSVGASFAAMPMTADSSGGKIYTDDKGMTLYTFDKDEAGKSNCYDECAKNWPPYLATADDKAEGEWTLIDRTDGAKQWAYEGKPVYLWVKDTKPGDLTGDMVGEVWHVLKAD